MAVPFNDVAGDIRVPFFHAELGAGGTPRKARTRLLLMGQMLPSGAAEAGRKYHLRDSQYAYYFGAGSMLEDMARAAQQNAPYAEIWFLPLEDDAAGIAATGKLTLGGLPITQPGTLSLYIAGERVRVAVKLSYSAADIALAIAAVINASKSIPLSAAINGVNDNEIDLLATHTGSLGNGIEIDFGLEQDEGFLGRALVSVSAMSGGSGDPEIADALIGLGDEEFDWIVMPYSDLANLDEMQDFLSNSSGRWSPSQQLYGHAITARNGNYSAFQTLGNSRNDAHLTIFPCNKFRTPSWMVAAALGAKAWKHLSQAPELSRPLQTIVMEGIKGPLDSADAFDGTERNTLYYDGISGYHIRATGQVAIDRLITTYQANDWGDPDATYLDVNTIAQAVYAIRYLRQRLTNVHGRQALMDDAADTTAIPAGVATPGRVRNTIIHAYTELVMDAVMENADAFENSLVVERNGLAANRLDASLPLDHVNQLRIMAVAATSYLQRNRVTGLITA